MLPRHKEIFFNIAQQFNCWIGVREPNELADRWVEQSGYIAKPLSCKPKTADNTNDEIGGGLVANPFLRPQAFTSNSREDAKEIWKKFLDPYTRFKPPFFQRHNAYKPETLQDRFAPVKLPEGYSCIEEGKQKGLVTLNGCFIHADYDLMTILQSDGQGNRSTTSIDQTKVLVKTVVPVLNTRFGFKLIQHGSEMEWNKGVGARDSELIWWFGPKNQFLSEKSYMPTKKPELI